MIKPLPPTLAWLLLVASVPLGLLAPILGPVHWPWRAAGLLPIVVGLGLAGAGHRLFARSGANIDTFGDPTSLVESGPFAYTRNPMYLGLAIFLAGAAIVIGSLTAWVAPTVFVVVCDRWYVPLEERRMADVFGTDYAGYQSRVPRWLGRATSGDVGSS